MNKKTAAIISQREQPGQLNRAWQYISSQPWLTLAFICYWIWVNMAYQTPVGFPASESFGGFTYPTRLMPITVSILAYLVLSIWFKRSTRVIRQSWYPALLVGAMSLGSLVIILAFPGHLIIAALLVGVSSACLCIEMQRVFGHLGSQYVLFIGCAAMLVSSLFIFFLSFCPEFIRMLVMFLSPLPIAWGVRKTVRKINAKSFYTHGITAQLFIPYRFLITAMLHGLTIGVTLGFPALIAKEQSALQLMILSYALAGILLFFIAMLFRLNYNHLIYHIGFPLAAMGALLLCVGNLPELGLFVQLMGFNFLHLLMWGLCTYFIKNLNLPATWVIATATCAFMCGQFIGGVASTLMANLSNIADSLRIVAGVTVFVILFGSLLLTSNRNLKTGWGLAHFGSNVNSDAASELAVKAMVTEFALTKRETDTLGLLVRGKSRKAISDELFISEETVKTHASSIYEKLSVHSRQELIAIFDERRLQIKLEEPTSQFE